MLVIPVCLARNVTALRSVEIARYMAAILDQDRLRLQRSFRSAMEIAKVAMGLAGDGQTKSQNGTGFAAFGRGVKSSQAAARGGSGDVESSSMPTVKVSVETKLAFWEVLSYWELLEDDEIEKAFVEALGQVAWRNMPARVCVVLPCRFSILWSVWRRGC